MSLEAGTKVLHYVIQRKLGVGGMGEVYLADDTHLQRKVALKFLSEEMVADHDKKERFKREARAAAALQHANIVTIHEVGEYRGRPFFVMQYAEGTSLRDQMAHGPMGLERFFTLARQLCAGLGEAHSRGVTHRDIKAANIMVDSRDRLLLLDFGLARISGQRPLTEAGLLVGTLGYMPPEVIRGEGADHRSDIFSVGVLLYEMLTGRQPFRHEVAATTLSAILEKDPVPLSTHRSDIPDGLQAVIDKAMAKNPDDRFQSVDELLIELRAVDPGEPWSDDSTQTFSGRVVPPVYKPWWKRIPSAATIGAGLIALALLTWIFWPDGRNSAEAADNRLAVMYFENLADPDDPDRLGEIITSLLITDLSASDYIQIVSSQRIYDLVQELGQEETGAIDRGLASKVAERAGARWMLLGRILRVRPELTVQTELVELHTGDLVASHVTKVGEDQDVYDMVDQLTVDIKDELSLPVGALEEPDPDIADVTTRSVKAWRHYLEGLRLESKLYYDEALNSFLKAIEYDSTFAMAYLWLAWFHDRDYIDKAVKYSNKVSEKERQYILSLEARLKGDYKTASDHLQKIVKKHPDEREAYYWLGNIAYSRIREPDTAIGYLQQAVAIDPKYKKAYNVLAYAYNDIGQYDSSIWAINKYIDLAGPDEANPYDSRGELYAWNGRLELAIESYEKALEIKPGFGHTLPKLGMVYLFTRDYALADSCFVDLATSSDRSSRAQGRTLRALIPIFQGDFDSALTVLEHGLIADQMDDAHRHWNAQKRYLQSRILLTLGREKEAIAKMMECIQIRDSAYPNDVNNMRDVCVWQLTQAGALRQAEKLVAEIEKRMRGSGRKDEEAYWRTKGALEMARGNTTLAIEHLHRVVEGTLAPEFRTRLMLGKAYLQTGQLGLAVQELEAVLRRYDEQRAFSPICAVQAHYLMGKAYEESGWHRQAVEQYREFLNYWGNSDVPMPELKDARARLKRLDTRL